MIIRTPQLNGGSCDGCIYRGEAGARCKLPEFLSCVESTSKRGVRFFIFVETESEETNEDKKHKYSNQTMAER